MRTASLPTAVRALSTLLLLFAALSPCAAQEQKTPASSEKITVDAAIAPYQKVEGVSGNLNSIGSDTLNDLMTYWCESFRKEYPPVNTQMEGKGSGTAPPALAQGTAQLGPMSRAMTPAEEEAIEAKYGVKPTAIGVSLDALTVYVNKDNPLESLTLPQIDAIFSKSRKSNYPEDITTWGQLGLKGRWASLPISIYGRNSASGTYKYFKEHVLAKGDYKDTVKEQPGSSAVVQAVSSDPAGIGYSGTGYKTSGVKSLSVAKSMKRPAAPPTYANVLNGEYPLSRLLYIYVVKKPGEPVSPQVKEFLKFVLSKQGQEIVVKSGFLPLPAATVKKQLELLESR